MLRYAITDGHSNDPGLILDRARRWADEGIDFVQLREKHLEAGQLLRLAESLLQIFADKAAPTRLLINSRLDIAAALGTGVHLTSGPNELIPAQARQVFATVGVTNPLISIACHSLAEVDRATAAGVNLILFGPVFEKRVNGELVVPGVGIEILRQACRAANSTPVLALGGISAHTTSICLESGAAGVAGIRLFA